MNPFLRQVAAHYCEGSEIERYCFVFPNRRSLVFFRKYLSGMVWERPVLAPQMYTINDFFYKVYSVHATDRLHLILELYDCYKALNPEAEPLDEFVFWGDVILSDFDDIDKYLADARGLFRNVSDFKEIQDTFEYLTQNQEEAIAHFLSHFRDSKHLDKGVKGKFVKLWNILFPLYESFRKRLMEKGMAYEGMVYRSVASGLKGGASVKDLLEPVFPETVKYVFVGLNALNECERLLLRRMRDARLADFCWDYVSSMIKDRDNKSSFFMKKNVEEFPQAFQTDAAGLKVPKITVVDVPSSVGQAKLAPWILSLTCGDSVETAFVLPDQNLLLPLLNSIPPSYDNINVTMGYPMSSSAVYTLLDALGSMQMRLRKRPDGWYFYHAAVREVFASGLFRELLGEDERKKVEAVKAAAKYYIPLKDLQGGPVLDMIFSPVIEDVTVASARQNHLTEEYLQEVVGLVGRTLTGKSEMLLELDFAKRCHTQLNILRGTDLDVLPATHIRLLQRILQGISVPFRGEPLKGLQVMGPLETRALDFRYLVVLSANEGMFPRRSISSSFIPPELRKGFGLPTYEFQDAVWAYYFYRMIQRPEHVWLVYDSRTEGLKSGEESRYIKQLEYHFGVQMERITAAPSMQAPKPEEEIAKTREHVDAVRERLLSASAINKYAECPASFYYQAVKGLKTDDEVSESLDSRMLGNVFHHVMKALYETAPVITPERIDAFRKDVKGLKALIRNCVLEELHSIEVTGRNLVLEEVILDYVQATLRHDASLLAATDASEGFRIISLEKPYYGFIGGLRFFGYLDRLDSYKDGEVRVVDYKTGKVDDGKDGISPKIAMQFHIYNLLCHQQSFLAGKQIVDSVYSIRHMYTGNIPDMPEDPEVAKEMTAKLEAMLSDISNLDIPWSRTEDRNICSRCDFKDICGR